MHAPLYYPVVPVNKCKKEFYQKSVCTEYILINIRKLYVRVFSLTNFTCISCSFYTVYTYTYFVTCFRIFTFLLVPAKKLGSRKERGQSKTIKNLRVFNLYPFVHIGENDQSTMGTVVRITVLFHHHHTLY